MSSAKCKLLSPYIVIPLLVDLSAHLVITSRCSLKKSGDRLQFCFTPSITLNHSVMSLSTLTALYDFLYSSTPSLPVPHSASVSLLPHGLPKVYKMVIQGSVHYNVLFRQLLNHKDSTAGSIIPIVKCEPTYSSPTTSSTYLCSCCWSIQVFTLCRRLIPW